MEISHITGVPELVEKLIKIQNEKMSLIRQNMREAGKHLLRESQKIVPVQLGNLKASGFVQDVTTRKDAPDVIVGYTASYAVYVHENIEATHGEEFNEKHAEEISHAKEAGLKSVTARGGMFNRGSNQQAKFLERPMRVEGPRMLKIIAQGT
jgi:hypothetical protein